MRIAIVSHYFESHRGGVESVAGQLARALTRRGQDVTWLACDSSPPPADPAVCARAVPLPAINLLERRTGIPYPLPLPAAANRLSRAIAGTDAVLLQDGCYLSCVLARLVAARAAKPVVLMQHIGSVPYRGKLPRLAMATLNRLVTRPMLAAVGQVVFISELTQRHFAGLRLRRPALLLFNGVDAGMFAPLPAGSDRAALRRLLGLDPAAPTVLFVGRFVEKKGLAHLREMARRRPDWQWVLAGWGPLDPAGWRLPNVKVFTGRAGRTLAPLYQAADALALPSVGEGYPLVVQEALACGLPVVCGADTATADRAARPYLAGIPVAPADPAATATAFLAALAPLLAAPAPDREARATFARERYSWDGMAEALLNAIDVLRDAPR